MRYIAVTEENIFAVFALYKKNWVVINPHFSDKVKKLLNKFAIKYIELPPDDIIVQKQYYTVINKVEGYLKNMYREDYEKYLDDIKGIGYNQFIDDDNFEEWKQYLDSSINENKEFYAVKGLLNKQILEHYPFIKEREVWECPPDTKRVSNFGTVIASFTSNYYEALKETDDEEYEGIYYEACVNYMQKTKQAIEYGFINEDIQAEIEEMLNE